MGAVDALAAQFTEHPDTTTLCGHGVHDVVVRATWDGRPFTTFDSGAYAGCTVPGSYCPGDEPVGQVIAATGKWEAHITDTATAIVSSGRRGIVADVGACVGWFSALAGWHGRDVLGVEMVAEFVRVARVNAAGFDTDATIVQCCVDGSTPPVTVVDDIVLLKVDVEGNEPDVYRVFEHGFVTGRVRYAIFEISPVFNDRYPALIGAVLGHGYRVWRIAPGGSFVEWTAQNVDAAIGEFTQCDVVCAAPGMPVLW